MFHHFVLITKTIQPRPQVFSVNCSVFWQLCCTTDVISHMLRNFSKFGRQYLVMLNCAWDFSQSETEKYFEWIIIHNYWIRLSCDVKNYADLRGCYRPQWILHIIRKPNSIIVDCYKLITNLYYYDVVASFPALISIFQPHFPPSGATS